jgi:LacI family transcriptional regulator
MNRRKKVTIYDVAVASGVSRQTVSRVMNDRPDVAHETRERVLEVIQQLGYHPSQVARSLSQGISCTLGVIGYGIEYYGPSRTLSVIEQQANLNGYSLTLGLTHQAEEIEMRQLIDSMVSYHVLGIICAVPQIGNNRDKLIEYISEISVPVVCSNMHPHTSFSLVDSNNYDGGSLATQHLIDQGNQTIGIITGPSNWIASNLRLQGWRETLQAANLSCDDSLIVEGDWSTASGYQGLISLAENNPKLDAVFACNDQMALGALKAAAKIGKQVPEDFCLVGYDNIPEAEYFSSSLTTIRQNFSEQGKMMVKEMERRISALQAGKPDKPMDHIMQPDLIIRASSLRT